MELACSNIAMQRIVNDHTNYMLRVRTKFKMDREIFEHQQARETLKLLHNHHVPPTPQPWGTIIFEGSRAP